MTAFGQRSASRLQALSFDAGICPGMFSSSVGNIAVFPYARRRDAVVRSAWGLRACPSEAEREGYWLHTVSEIEEELRALGLGNAEIEAELWRYYQALADYLNSPRYRPISAET